MFPEAESGKKRIQIPRDQNSITVIIGLGNSEMFLTEKHRDSRET